MPEGVGAYSWGEIRKGMDRPMFFAVAVLFALGLLSIYSSDTGVRRTAAVFTMRQFIWGCISFSVYAAIVRFGHARLVEWSYAGYTATLALLAVLVMIGQFTRGAASWFKLASVSFQPAELGKVTLILCLAKFFSKHPPKDLRTTASALAIAGLSVMLVLAQPDLGSSLVYLAIIFSMLVVAGAPGRYLAALVSIGLIGLPIFWSMLKTYQKLRLIVFLDPYIDPQGAGYNVIQSRIAVGSGGLWGKGFLHGTQGRLHFLPEPHTDFIFSVYAEEFGFVGCCAVVLLFAFLFWRILRAAFRTRDLQSKLVCVGVAAWMWFQVMESIAMSMGLAPITGLPLPLFSYGGSSLLMTMTGLALVQSVAILPVRERFAEIR